MAYVYQEFPKWITGPNGERLIVANAEAEALQRQAWGAASSFRPIVNALTSEPPSLPQLDHDHNGEPGGSTKPAGDDLPSLRATYKEKFGKKPFAGWDADTLKAKLEASE